MPAAAVIPAPIAYIKVVAVKKLVVGSRDALVRSRGLSRQCPPALHCRGFPTGGGTLRRAVRRSGVLLREQSPVPLAGSPGAPASFTLKKLECSKQAEAGLNNGAWNNGIGSRFYFVGFRNSR